MIDDLLERDGVTYDDLARAAEPGGDKEPSILKGIYHDVPGRDEMLAAWMASDDRDETIAAKGAVDELVKLLGSRIGLALDRRTAWPSCGPSLLDTCWSASSAAT